MLNPPLIKKQLLHALVLTGTCPWKLGWACDFSLKLGWRNCKQLKSGFYRAEVESSEKNYCLRKIRSSTLSARKLHRRWEIARSTTREDIAPGTTDENLSFEMVHVDRRSVCISAVIISEISHLLFMFRFCGVAVLHRFPHDVNMINKSVFSLLFLS